MGKFRVQAMNAAGQAVDSEIHAATLDEALAQSRRQGHFPVRVREMPPVKSSRAPLPKAGGTRFFLGRVSTGALTEFTRQLAMLQDAGMPIVRSIDILARQQPRSPIKAVFDSIGKSIEEGATLSEAMARHPRTFSRLYISMIQAGEAGGMLEIILLRLADLMEKSQRLRRRIKGAMIYPASVMVVALLIVTGIVVFVVPRFREIFRDFKADLPAITVYLLSFSDFVANRFGWAILLGIPLGVWLLVKMLRRSAAGRVAWDALLLRVPVLGRIVRKSAISRFSRTLGTLLAAGVPILDALQIARDTVGNAVFERSLGRAQRAIREGQSLTVPLRESKAWGLLVCNMIEVGEETGDLDKMLLKIADAFDDQVDTMISSLVSLLEPLMVIALGVIVGGIVLALFMPLVTILQKLTNPG